MCGGKSPPIIFIIVNIRIISISTIIIIISRFLVLFTLSFLSISLSWLPFFHSVFLLLVGFPKGGGLAGGGWRRWKEAVVAMEVVVAM